MKKKSKYCRRCKNRIKNPWCKKFCSRKCYLLFTDSQPRIDELREAVFEKMENVKSLDEQTSVYWKKLGRKTTPPDVDLEEFAHIVQAVKSRIRLKKALKTGTQNLERWEKHLKKAKTDYANSLIPSKNKPCPCNSGKKYKLCCGKK
jgi:uncharacterized protein YecA (UPF0149 family)